MTADALARQLAEAVSCPHCGEDLGLEVVTQVKDKSRLVLSIAPKDGELLAAEHVGGMLTQMHKLLAAVSRSLGARSATMLERIDTADDGTLRFHLLVARVPGARPRRRPGA